MGLTLSWHQCRDRNWPGLRVGVEKYLVLVRGSKLTLSLCGGIEIDLILEWGSNWFDFSSGVQLTWFLCEGSKLTVCGPKLTCFKCDDRLAWFCVGGGGRNWLGFWMSSANRLVLVWESKLTKFLFGWSILTWFHCGGSNFTWFQWKDKNWLVFYVGAENDLVFVLGSNLTWCKY